MDAPILRFAVIALSLLISTGAGFQTRNFSVTAPTQQIAEQVGNAAEDYRRELATFWLGQPLPNWSRPCTLKVQPGAVGAGGETTFQFVRGTDGMQVINWKMRVQGSLERILDSVLPHEVNHTIFACHFRRPLPRWADEGAATLFEHRSEQMKQLDLLNRVIKSDRELIALPTLLNMKEYPKDMRRMLILYAEGYALVDFLVQQGGRTRYLKFLKDGEQMGWERAITENYAHEGVGSLQENWQGWVIAGMPKLTLPDGQMVADAGSTDREITRPEILDRYRAQATLRGQSPDAEPRADVVKTAAALQRSVARESSPAKTDAPIWVSPSSTSRSKARPVTRGQEAGGHSMFSESARPPSATQETQPTTTTQGRRAAIEAPTPGTSSAGEPANSQSNRFQPPVERRGSYFEATNHRRDADLSPSQRHSSNHLPQDRNVESGDIPQWAGFPGQKEFF